MDFSGFNVRRNGSLKGKARQMGAPLGAWLVILGCGWSVGVACLVILGV